MQMKAFKVVWLIYIFLRRKNRQQLQEDITEKS